MLPAPLVDASVTGILKPDPRAYALAVEALDTPGGPGLVLDLQHKLFDRLVYGRLRAALGGSCAALGAISGTN